jgi:hypothetical protein
VGAVTVSGGVVYAGGWFRDVGGVPRVSIAAIDAITARPTRFDAQLQDEYDVVTAMAVSGRTLYIGGGFGKVASEVRTNLAALDATTGSVTRWNPRPAERVGARNGGLRNVRIRGVIDALVAQGNFVYAGGRISSMGDWVERNGAVALDLTSGVATAWDPHLEGNFVTGLGVIGNRVYLTGSFLRAGGTPKFCLAAVDATSGSLLDWGPAQPSANQLTAGPTSRCRGTRCTSAARSSTTSSARLASTSPHSMTRPGP